MAQAAGSSTYATWERHEEVLGNPLLFLRQDGSEYGKQAVLL